MYAANSNRATKPMNVLEVYEKFYTPDSELWDILLTHSNAVTQKALEVAIAHPELEADGEFICEAAMLHDIGIVRTNAPGIKCFGDKDYICHGYLGSEMLHSLGLERHALVCERHTGAGITIADIEQQGLPLPKRDMLPVSIEEQIICYADKFFSKSRELDKAKTFDEALRSVSKYGEASAQRFLEMHNKFSY